MTEGFPLKYTFTVQDLERSALAISALPRPVDKRFSDAIEISFGWALATPRTSEEFLRMVDKLATKLRLILGPQ